ncbi:hypothetical protein HDU87_005057 [Geranomyces variabilis]|uniref:NudC domain-containing protein 1 n=1 Tax=Geranomyces variabilis TaxID=109894 RepID=A0AAD5TQI0_9FUNG|nr:hypothetical protein HDU87_005057 [Geranomyces variabilis]
MPPNVADIVINAALLNPRFESYKLSLHGPFKEPHTTLLPQPCAHVKCPSSPHDSFRKLQARASFNHLFYTPEAPPSRAFYINANYQVVEMCFDPASKGVLFNALWELPSPSSTASECEYPSVLCIGNFLLASNGAGYIGLQPQHTLDTTPISLALPGEHSYILLDAHISGASLFFLAYRMEERKVNASPAPTHTALAAAVGDHKAKKLKTVPQLAFCLSLFAVNLDRLRDGDVPAGDVPQPVRTVTSVEGFSVPYFAKIEPDGLGFTVGAATLYQHVPRDGESSAPTPQPTAPAVPPSTPTTIPPKPHSRNYKWYQTGEDVTITVRLPAKVERTDIHVALTPESIKLRTLRPTEHTLFDVRALWESILPSECIWTLEEEDKSLLTLHLAKKHEGTRWLQLWEEDDGVNETLSAEELKAFASALDKYTEPAAQDNANDDGDDGVLELGAATAMDVDDPQWTQPLTMENAMTEPSEDVDFEGSPVTIARFPADPAAAAAAAATHIARSGGQEWLCNAFSFQHPSLHDPPIPAIVLRSDVDALLYTVTPQSSSSSSSSSQGLSLTTHTAAFPALGFVQASKRDRRFTAITRDAQLAFIVEPRRAFVYEQPGRALQAAQYVLDFGMFEAGDKKAAAAAAEGVGTGAGADGAGDVVGLQQIAERVVLVLRERAVTVLDWS